MENSHGNRNILFRIRFAYKYLLSSNLTLSLIFRKLFVCEKNNYDLLQRYVLIPAILILIFFHISATKWLRILSLDGIDKIRNHLIANPVLYHLVYDY